MLKKRVFSDLREPRKTSDKIALSNQLENFIIKVQKQKELQIKLKEKRVELRAKEKLMEDLKEREEFLAYMRDESR